MGEFFPHFFMAYIDGYVLPIKKKDLKAYKKVATAAGKVWMECGALSYTEAASDDLDSMKDWGGVHFGKLSGMKKGEIVIFAFVKYKSRKHRDQVNAKVHTRMEKDAEKFKDMSMPFDMKRMAYGGFKAVVEGKRK